MATIMCYDRCSDFLNTVFVVLHTLNINAELRIIKLYGLFGRTIANVLF